MYYIIYPILYLLSLLPLRVLYLFSGFVRFLLFSVTGYRKKVVLGNLRIAFPEKTEEERRKIAKQFYLNFTDTFLETIKLISMSDEQFEKHSSGDFSYINALTAKGCNVHIMAAHQFNWEFANLQYSKHLDAPFVAVYMPIGNRALDRIFLKLRSRYGTILVPAVEFRERKDKVFPSRYTLALAADQNPGNPSNAYWMSFFGLPVPFLTGPARGAVKNNCAVVFVSFHRLSRGKYQFRVHPIAEEGEVFTPQELTSRYRDRLEETIRLDPANYLWSHRRWKWEWREEYGVVVN